MKKYLFIFLLYLCSVFNTFADITADWRIHVPFDAWATKVIDTQQRVYFLGRTFEYKPDLAGRDFNSFSLHYYDKAGDEILPVNRIANASDNIVSCVEYNHQKKYLLVVYTNCNIDFMYDDGRVENLQALKVTTVPGRKEVNSITFDNENDRVYLATSFGYVTLNDKKHEVAESRNYGHNIKAVARCGNSMVMTTGENLLVAPFDEKRFNFEDYTEVEGAPSVDILLPLEGGNFLGAKAGANGYVYTFEAPNLSWRLNLEDENIVDIQTRPDGYSVVGNNCIINYNGQGVSSSVETPENLKGFPKSTYDLKNYWVLSDRSGIRSFSVDGEGNWKITHNTMRPNSPATFLSTSMVYHPQYGMLAGSNGKDIAYNESNQATPGNISGLKNSFWTEYSPIYRYSSGFRNLNNYFGLSMDPSNNNYIYRGSMTNGMVRINLADPKDLLIMANPSNVNKTCETFVEIVPDLASWAALCRFSTPQFSSDGTMWTLYNNADTHQGELYYWPAADRQASTSPSNFRPMKKITMPADFRTGNEDVMLALKSTQNKNIVVIGGIQNGGSVLVYDHNGTPGVKSDDRYVYIDSGHDQDGGSVLFMGINNFYEDPETGLVWILSQRGAFTINPATIFDNPKQINRIKVSRNDGTNLADYLLNEVNVNHLNVDGEGRKWFATSNGLVCTSKDGKRILGEFSADDSYLPDNNVYHTCYNPDNNSMMVATGAGLVEMFPSGGGNSAVSANDVRIYPNPVEPDYYGWVRIDNIADGSLVKITDGKGGLVKELGPAEGGGVEWDVSGLNNSRVSTGVYYIMVSPASSGGLTTVNKILVLN